MLIHATDESCDHVLRAAIVEQIKCFFGARPASFALKRLRPDLVLSFDQQGEDVHFAGL